jgi:cytochrome c553
MKKMILRNLLTAGLFSMALIPAAYAAGDIEAGKKKFYTCEGCHSIEGYTNAYPAYNVPRLGAQHADYIVAALKAYQANQRQHGSMRGNATTLSDADMNDIAAYVAKFKGIRGGLPVTGNVAAGKEKAAACAGCHGENGNNDKGSIPRLAAQYESYLIKALEDYKSGKRNNPIMAGFAAGLSDEDIRDIAAYYASQSRGLTIPQD